MTMVRSSTKVLLALAAMVPLAGCISLAPKPPASLLTLTSTTALPAGNTQTSGTAPTITIQVPVVGQSLAGTRIPVQASETSIAYVAKAQWVEPPNRMFARLLSDTIPAKTGRIVLSSSQAFSDPGAVLSGELRAFGVDAGTQDAVVVFDGSLIRTTGKVVEKHRFEARVHVSTIAAVPVSVALNQAANTVAGEVADWVGK
ncbi:ABC-type transport auxiliary lipoprotein family protein [Sphingomonas echinoides]|jgi:cholesterol transport system auxiliary component|uniref:ABC-type transport auxiliary lipoprotein family protein n=1 Tax=Sphingomonas echinoides TaxID=59803 RepID=A0ABU4PH79_9SPHN|nr:ABC-type transport auxiliary lipoprotein family protein [Sphingomonas echinoides]MDX5983553.1 ABC-type transport auxiliary lipoprotein family protein [Sphingomonas echinoides]